MFSHHSSFALPAILWAIHGGIIVVYEENLEYRLWCLEKTVGP